jgi:hypothetical protein
MRLSMVGFSYGILSLECDRPRFPRSRSGVFELRKSHYLDDFDHEFLCKFRQARRGTSEVFNTARIECSFFNVFIDVPTQP